MPSWWVHREVVCFEVYLFTMSFTYHCRYKNSKNVYEVTRLLTLKHRETHGCVVSTVATDALVLKHQAISILSADWTSIVLDMFHKKILHICWTTFGNKIVYWKKWPSSLRVKYSNDISYQKRELVIFSPLCWLVHLNRNIVVAYDRICMFMFIFVLKITTPYWKICTYVYQDTPYDG